MIGGPTNQLIRQMANLLFSNSRYQQIPGLADWSIADLPGLVNSDYFPTPRSLVTPTRGAGGLHGHTYVYRETLFRHFV